MPSFLSKLFRSKKKTDEASTSASKASSKKSRTKSKQKKSKVDKVGIINNSNNPAKTGAVSSTGTANSSKPPHTTQELRRPSNGGTSNYSSNSSSEPHVRVLSPRNNHNHVHTNNNMMTDNINNRSEFNDAGLLSLGNSPNGKPLLNMMMGSGNGSGGPPNNNGNGNHAGWSAGPVDLDESDLGSDTDENQMQTRIIKAGHGHNNSTQVMQQQQQRLSVQQLHRFDMQQQKREATAQFYMPKDEPPRFSAGHVLEDETNRSDASSSSFNLSTDAEDTEYENLKRRGVVPNPNLDSSQLSSVSSPTNYNTDGDNSIFPALQTDDEGTTTERETSVLDGILPAKASTTDEDEDVIQIARSRSNNSSKKSPPTIHHRMSGEEDERAWTISPTKDGANPFPFHNPTSPTQQHRRNFTSPKLPRSPHRFTTSALSTSKNNNDGKDEFADFADFSNVTFPADTEAWGTGAPPKTNNGNTKIVVDGSPPPVSPGGRKSHRSSLSAADMTLSDILAQAKGKRISTTSSHRSTGSGGGRRHVSSSSVNSAPAITAKYLRQHHNLRGSSSRHSNSGDQDGTTPVSDIIDSLEMANASRSSNHSVGGGSHSKSVSRSSHDPSRAAKDRMRDRRRHSSSRRRSDPNHTNESSEGSDHEASESWLFDEVTGALGPRGIAADLESLSGRSKSSSGNKSHKSHRSHRSHRSHGRSSRRRKSSSKHHPSSGESVDSRGSRHSRSSRYSHKSTRSYLSQMSEQSRSVANDLLRLEMQLAMVGSQDNNAAAVAGSSASVASRASRKSRSSARRTVAIARRNKVTIQAPPGKLGIILANKADSKGTVVSGVRSSSVLSEKISPGDRIVAIDGEDVSLMTVSEITTIMARKSDFERTLTVLTTPKHNLPSSSASSQQAADARNGMVSPTKSKDYDSYHSHSRYSSSGR